MTYDYDLIVIGAGMAGVTAAHKCASVGWKVAILMMITSQLMMS